MSKNPVFPLVLLSLGGAFAQSSLNADQISYVLEVRGALQASQLLLKQNSLEDSKKLIGTATTKRWDRVKFDLSSSTRKAIETDASDLLKAFDTADVQGSYGATFKKLDSRLVRLVPRDLKLNVAATALERILMDVAFYYNRGMKDGKIISPRVQAIGATLVPQAQLLVARSPFPAEVVALVDTLQTKTNSLASGEEIQALVTTLRGKISTAAGLPPVNLTTPLFFDRTLLGLKLAQNAYHAGDNNQALKLLSEAYLDGFEFLEIPIAAKNPDMKAALETLMGKTLPQLVLAEKPISEVDVQFNALFSGLAQASELVSGK